MHTGSKKRQSPAKGLDLVSGFSRLELGHLPTALEFLPNVTESLGGPKIFVKRDDCTGLGSGGNKTRKLEFLMADAIKNGSTYVLTQGAVQSNHVRQTAAAACKLSLKCELFLEHRVSSPTDDYVHSGNVYLDHLFGAKIHHLEKGSDMDDAMAGSADRLRHRGESPYVIPGGGSTPIGALGYVACAQELLAQSQAMNMQIGHIVHATGSAGTQAGLLAGLRASGSEIPVLGVGVNADKKVQEERVFSLACDTAALIGAKGVVSREDVVADCNYIGGGYGISTPAMVSAVTMMARQEGLLFDPVYSGKGLAGMIDLIKKGYFEGTEYIVFIHTGGSAALFSYREAFREIG